ncbi:uncharacterized protein LOC128169121 [Crassostrea angulata]|uniref:uncharacterized protein LOC128169121 n=1 Tax=Magallana angulata TaxID=2784310 RepID=UPI0022B19913|nr:uncharacterized protein LOC128169121 [Crassostrea angulata]
MYIAMQLSKIFRYPWYLFSILVSCYGSLKTGFSLLQHGHRLDGKLIQSFAELSFLDCVTECMMTPRCKSVNYFKGANFCESNYENKTTAEKRYMESAGWVYSEKVHWPKPSLTVCSACVLRLVMRVALDIDLSFTIWLELVQTQPVKSARNVDTRDILKINSLNVFIIFCEDAIGIHRRIHASCADGYSQSGSGRLICQSNGEWKYDIVCEEAASNLALNKPATQSSTFTRPEAGLNYSANLAVDGNNGTDQVVDKCSHTEDGDTNPWWSVDLQAIYTIKSVRIFNRGIDKWGVDVSDRLQNVTVIVGQTESDVNTPCGFFAGPGTLSQLVVIDCQTSPQGRFVKISIITEHLTLCEVEVFGYSV